MKKISNLDKYNKRMKKALTDKLFFLNLVKNDDIEAIVDFGCADGCLLKEVSKLKKDWKLFGIDNNEKMLDKAIMSNSKLSVAKSFEELNNLYEIDKSKAILNISSVIHEIYSYCSQEEIDDFWYHVLNDGYKYVVIRDMSVSSRLKTDAQLLRLAITKFLNKNHFYIKSGVWKSFKEESYKRNESELMTIKDLIEFLLKYRYVNNWDRELHENYLPISTEFLLEKISNSKYKVEYENHFILPFIKKDIKRNFNFDLIENTHIKLILKLENN